MKTPTESILELIGKIKNTPDELKNTWHPNVLTKIENLVNDTRPLHMVLPAFPAKSPNSKKTLDACPDYGEVLALERLEILCRQIREIYPPGASLTICSDGRVFSDVVHVPDELVNSYHQGLHEILATHRFCHLKLFSLEDVFTTLNFESMRRHLMQEFGEDLETLRARVKFQPEAKILFNGIHRFMYEDQVFLHPEQTKSQLREKAKNLAYEVILRSNAWSRLIEKKFPEALRLSIHPQSLVSEKIGVRLLPSKDLWRTPWHSVAVFDGQRYYLAPRASVEAAGGQLTLAYQRYAYFTLISPQSRLMEPAQEIAL